MDMSVSAASRLDDHNWLRLSGDHLTYLPVHRYKGHDLLNILVLRQSVFSLFASRSRSYIDRSRSRSRSWSRSRFCQVGVGVVVSVAKIRSTPQQGYARLIFFGLTRLWLMRQSRYSTLTQLTLYLSWSTQLWLNSMIKFASLTQLRLNSFESRVVSQNWLTTHHILPNWAKSCWQAGGGGGCCRMQL